MKLDRLNIKDHEKALKLAIAEIPVTDKLEIDETTRTRLIFSDIEIKILSALKSNPDGLTFGETVKAARMNYTGAYKHFANLENAAIIYRDKKVFKVKGIEKPVTLWKLKK